MSYRLLPPLAVADSGAGVGLGPRPCARAGRRAGGAASLLATLLLCCLTATALAEPSRDRQRELVRIVRHDCGACHGMTLAGGLGPPLTAAALIDKPVGSMAATIAHGRPGTPMPPWRSLLSETDVRWIAEQLVAGFPKELR